MEEKEGGVYTLIGGDFNARIGEEGGGWGMEGGGDRRGEEEEGRRRKSKDGKMKKDGKVLVQFLKERGWGILNGCKDGDEEGEYTFTRGKENTVIDYVIGDEEVRERVGKLRIGERVDSDHHPVEVWIKRGDRKERRAKEGKGVKVRVEYGMKKIVGSLKEEWRR